MYLSYQSYNKAIINKNTNKPKLVKVFFFKKQIKQQFNIDSNCIIIIVNSSYFLKEDGLLSIINLNIQCLVIKYLISLLKVFNKEKKVRFDKQKFFVKVISLYLEIINSIINTINNLKNFYFLILNQNII